MNILILNWRDPKNPKAGGAEIVTHQHAKAWVKRGHQVTWLASLFNGAQSQETIDGVHIVRKGTSISVFLHAPLYYFSNSFDVVVDEIHGLPFFTPLYVRKPKIAFIHEVAEEIWDYMYSFPLNKIGRVAEKFYFKLYKEIHFWTDAKSTILDLEKYGIKKSQCIAIPCPITNEVFQGRIIKEKKTTVIFVSRLVKMKGIEDVIQAFGTIKKTKKDAELWIVGEGDKEYINFLKMRVKNLGLAQCVKFWGYVPTSKKLDLMRRAHVLLHASVKEGWGLVVLEAASQGTPSIVYNSGSLSEVVKDDFTGVVVKKRVPKALSDAAISLIDDGARYMKYQKNGIEWVNSLHWDEVTEKSLRLLQSV